MDGRRFAHFLLLSASLAVSALAGCSRCASLNAQLGVLLREEAARVGAGDLPDASGVPHLVYRFGPDLLDALAAAIDPDRVLASGIYRRVVNEPEPGGTLVDGAAVVLSLQLELAAVAFEPEEAEPRVRFVLVDRASRVALNVGSSTREWTLSSARFEVVAPIVFDYLDHDAVIVADLEAADYVASGFLGELPPDIADVVDRLVRDATLESRSAGVANVELIRLGPILIASDRLQQRVADMGVRDGGLELTTVTPLRPRGTRSLVSPQTSGAVAHPDLARAAVEYALAVQTGLRRVDVDEEPATLSIDTLAPVVSGFVATGSLWCVEAESCRLHTIEIACSADLHRGDASISCGSGLAGAPRASHAVETVLNGLIESLGAQLGPQNEVLPVALDVASGGVTVGWVASGRP